MAEGPPIKYNERSSELHGDIIRELRKLIALDYPSCLDEGFKKHFFKIHELYDLYQKEVLIGSGVNATCSEGCSFCCCHWVDDVYSFEAEILSDYIKRNMPEKIPGFIASLKEDTAHLEYLDKVISEKVTDEGEVPHDLDHREVLLSCFYILKRPCMLVDPEGRCSIYPLRPLTCRIYVSLGNPEKCDPDKIDEEDAETCILDLDKEGDTLFEELHAKYDRFDDERGLRALLLETLLE